MTYKPGDQPDPAFTAFFAGEWQRMLEAVVIPGTDGETSWDRKAAWLYWELSENSTPFDVFGMPVDSIKPERTTKPTEHAFSYPSARGQAKPAPTVGTPPAQSKLASALTFLLNYTDDDDCTPEPNGVQFQFNSGEW